MSAIFTPRWTATQTDRETGAHPPFGMTTKAVKVHLRLCYWNESKHFPAKLWQREKLSQNSLHVKQVSLGLLPQFCCSFCFTVRKVYFAWKHLAHKRSTVLSVLSHRSLFWWFRPQDMSWHGIGRALSEEHFSHAMLKLPQKLMHMMPLA